MKQGANVRVSVQNKVMIGEWEDSSEPGGMARIGITEDCHGYDLGQFFVEQESEISK